MPNDLVHRAVRRSLLCLAAALGACGGNEERFDSRSEPLSCSVTDQRSWLGAYVDAWYLWSGLSPRPDPAGFATAEDYLQALRYTGTDSRFPPDRWTTSQTTESHERLFGAGTTLGYGLSVAALEVAAGSHAQLYIREVDPRSPAAATGNILRGDYVVALNGVRIENFIASGDYSLLSPRVPGETLTLTYSPHGTRPRSEVLTAAVYPLQPVQGASVKRTPGGRDVGYVIVRDMIDQALAPLQTAFAGFKAAGLEEVVVDLRYNEGGLVSSGAVLASYLAGSVATGQIYAMLRHNDRRAAANDTAIRLSAQGSALALPRVVVITGRRTCGAAEQVVNGLRGVGMEVVTIGEATCGKPVGVRPVSACGMTHNVVSFETLNQRNEGRYFAGLAPTCAVADPYFFWGLGDTNETLLAAALRYIDTGSCPATASVATTARSASPRPQGADAGDRPTLP